MATGDREGGEAEFETVVAPRKARRRKSSDLPFTRRPLKHDDARTTMNFQKAGRMTKANNSTFGRSSWSRPTRISYNDFSTPATLDGEDRRVVTEEPSSHFPAPVDHVQAAQSANDVPLEGTSSSDGVAVSQSMASLLAEYGEQDVEWEKRNISYTAPENDEDEGINTVIVSSIQEGQRTHPSRLGQQGKVPLHVELVSFGYCHGAPKELRDGWSHAQPLPSVDTRDTLATVPSYLAWQDGLAGSVKHAILLNNKSSPDNASESNGKNKVRDLADDLADRVAAALVAAIDEGGHGYVSPLCVQVFVGSDAGRHRSVVVVEMAAAAIRNRLRRNDGDRFACPCSVGTRHIHLDRKPRSVGARGKAGSAKAKQKDLEDDW